MPDPAVHASFGREVEKMLGAETRASLIREPFCVALFGPDPWFTYRFWRRRQGRGRQMHTTRTGEFLTALAEQARTGHSRQEMFSYLAGFLCHYCLDSTTHPYIIRMTTTEYHYPRCHMDFEHALDMLQARRNGTAESLHPVTDSSMPRIRLPESMREDLDAAYRKVYGWEGSWKALNKAYPRYRLVIRAMENPRGWLARLARLTRSPLLQSLAHAESHFRGTDVENEAHRPWAHSHDDSVISRESFGELRAEAEQKAARLIELCWRYIFRGEGTAEEVREQIGQYSYLSGLDIRDPRNTAVPSMMPFDEHAGRGSGAP